MEDPVPCSSAAHGGKRKRRLRTGRANPALSSDEITVMRRMFGLAIGGIQFRVKTFRSTRHGQMSKWHWSVLALALLAPTQQTRAAVPDYIKTAPAGQWTQIGSNTASDVKFSGWGSGAYPAEGDKFVQLFGVWAGAAYDPNIPALYFTGGGHGSYDGNEFYEFRLDVNAWERVNDPSPYLESQQVGGILPDGLPQAIHTYGEIECDWDTGIIYRLSNGGSAITTTWAFNPHAAAHPMAYPAQTTAAWTNITTAPVGQGYAGGFAWDPVTKKFYGGHSVSDFFAARYMDPGSGTYGKLPSPFGSQGFAPGLDASVTIDPDRRLMFVVGGQNSNTDTYVGRGLVTYNIDTQTWTNLTPTTTGDKLPETSYAAGFTYDSRRKLLWWWNGIPDTKSLFQFDYTTKTWTRITPAGASPAPAYAQGTYNKFRYIAAYDVFVAVGGTTSSDPQVWMYKPADWQPPGTTGDSTPPSSPTNLQAN